MNTEAQAARAEFAAGVRARYETGESIRQIAAATGRSYSGIHQILNDSGAVMRGRGYRNPSRKAQP